MKNVRWYKPWLGWLLLPVAVQAQPNPVLSGQVLDAVTRLPLPGASVVGVFVPVSRWAVGTQADASGRFGLTQPDARRPDSIRVSLVGYKPQTMSVPPVGAATVWLEPGQTLDEVTVRASHPDRATDSPQMGRIVLTVAQLTAVPSLLGERDLLRVLQLLPGVQKASEGNTGIYVRGGGPDQNLIRLDGATIYNPSHLLGFFSAFNGDAIRSIELTKGGFPARYGGRLSSVIELTSNVGNPDSLRAEATVGLLASRLLVQGPLAGRHTRFLLAARRTYLDLLARPLAALTGSEAGVSLLSYFYDLNATATTRLDPDNTLTTSAFYSRDAFVNASGEGASALRSGLNWQNWAVSLRWNRSQTTGLETVALLFSQYDLTIDAQQRLTGSPPNGPVLALLYQSGIRDWGLHYDRNELRRLLGTDADYRLGFQTNYHRFTPDASVTAPASSAEATPQRTSVVRQYIDALESGAYAEVTVKPGRWRINGGVRLSHYLLIGEGTTRTGGNRPPPTRPTDGLPTAIADTATSPASTRGGPVQYARLEPRLSVGYVPRAGLSVNLSYADMNQYVHLLSSTSVGLPTDLWIPTTDQLRPQHARQVALGLTRELPGPGLTLTLEGYHKTMQHLVSYAEGADFLREDGAAGGSIGTDNLVTGRGWSSGLEVFLQKKSAQSLIATGLNRLSGWIGYTLSRTQWQFADLNGGQPFFPRYDRRHDLSVVGLFALSPGMTLGGTFVYGTGPALTLPLARFSGFEDRPDPAPTTDDAVALFGISGSGSGNNVGAYGPRNAIRGEAYHRLDLNWQFRRLRQSGERVWNIGVYNVYNRRNPFYYALEGKDPGDGSPSQTVLYRYSLFSVLPSVSYTRKF